MEWLQTYRTGNYFFSALCFRMNSSLSIGIARSQTSFQGMVLKCSLVRCLSVTDFFIAKTGLRCYPGISGLSFFVPLQSFYEILLYRKIRWAQKYVSDRGSQPLRFLFHQYLLMSSSLGTPACNNSMSKLTFFETLYAA